MNIEDNTVITEKMTMVLSCNSVRLPLKSGVTPVGGGIAPTISVAAMIQSLVQSRARKSSTEKRQSDANNEWKKERRCNCNHSWKNFLSMKGVPRNPPRPFTGTCAKSVYGLLTGIAEK
jgi:hypothetical protein